MNIRPEDRKHQFRNIYPDLFQIIETAKDDTTEPKKVIIEFRNDMERRVARKVNQIPIDQIRFRKNNGRIASNVESYESAHGEIDESKPDGQQLIASFLEKKSIKDNDILKKSLMLHGQRDHAIITCDGFLINCNRRKMTLDKLREEFPNDSKYTYMRAVILPNFDSPGGPPTLAEIEQLENRLQLMKTGKAEYEGFDAALSIRRKLELGISLAEQLGDNPEHFSKTPNQLTAAKTKLKNEKVKPLECIDRYLKYFNRPNAYDSIENRWQTFVDYSKFHTKYLVNTKNRITNFGGEIDEFDIPKIEHIAFKLIRKQSLPGLFEKQKMHMIMRDLKKLFKPASKDFMFLIDEEIDKELNPEKIKELGESYTFSELDKKWSEEYDKKFSNRINAAKKASIKSEQEETPSRLLNDIMIKLNTGLRRKQKSL